MRKRSKLLIKSLCAYLMRYCRINNVIFDTLSSSISIAKKLKRPVKFRSIKIDPHISHTKRRPEYDVLSHWWKNGKKSTLRILKMAWHTTHFLKLIDKMCKYEMDPANVVKDTERTRFGLQTDRRMDKVKPVYPIRGPLQFRWPDYDQMQDWRLFCRKYVKQGRWLPKSNGERAPDTGVRIDRGRSHNLELDGPTR